jgi:hypothetical protein
MTLREKSYQNLKDGALDGTRWRKLGRGYRPVARKTTKWMNERTNA